MRTSAAFCLAVLLSAIAGCGSAAVKIEAYSAVDKDFKTSPDSNLIRGLRPVVEGAGFGVGGDAKCLTDGANGSGMLCSDTQPGQREASSTTLVFALPKNSDIGSIRVFSKWGDIRAYQCYDIEICSNNKAVYTTVAEDVRVGRPGEASFVIPKGKSATCVSEVSDKSGEPIGRNVYQVRLTFWPPGEFPGSTVNRFLERGKGRLGTCISEIEILPPGAMASTDADTGQ